MNRLFLLRGGADVHHVRAILGHKRPRTTGLYTRVNVEDLREVLGRARPLERAPCPRQYNRY